ncbi:MAG: hypothetical protein RL065_657 [Bacteroidota bacterium]
MSVKKLLSRQTKKIKIADLHLQRQVLYDQLLLTPPGSEGSKGKWL